MEGAFWAFQGKALWDEYQAFMDILGEWAGGERAWLEAGGSPVQGQMGERRHDRSM